MTDNNAPIILFVYNRPEHARQTIEALLSNPECVASDLFVYSDAPSKEQDTEAVTEVRKLIHSIQGFRSLTIVERKENYGIERQEIEAISEILNRYGKAIMLEDDVVVSNRFLEYMNLGLNTYTDDKQVYAINGYSFFPAEYIREHELPGTAFLQLFASYGWGTWKDRWQQLFLSIGKKELIWLSEGNHWEDFNYGVRYSEMLCEQALRSHVTWDVAWLYTIRRNRGVCLFPSKSLVNNIGMDGSGVHYTDTSEVNRIESIDGICWGNMPIVVEENQNVRNHLEEYFHVRDTKSRNPLYLIGKEVKHYYLKKKYIHLIKMMDE